MSAATRFEARSVPRLPRHVKFRFDQVRQKWVLLAPERLLLPDDIAVEILQQIDGERSIETIAAVLAAKFEAPTEEVAADVLSMLQDLAEKGYLVEGREAG